MTNTLVDSWLSRCSIWRHLFWNLHPYDVYVPVLVICISTLSCCTQIRIMGSAKNNLVQIISPTGGSVSIQHVWWKTSDFYIWHLFRFRITKARGNQLTSNVLTMPSLSQNIGVVETRNETFSILKLYLWVIFLQVSEGITWQFFF